MLSHEEYVEQAYLFRVLHERTGSDTPVQDLLMQTKLELLATTKLPMAIDFLVAELKHHGIMTDGMRRLSHYFTPFLTFVVSESETDRGRFEFRVALKILQAEAEYRSKSASRQGLFFFQFETLCRNRLNYDRGLKAMSEDPTFDVAWKEWILIVRRQLGLIDLADLIYGRSEEFVAYRKKRLGPDSETDVAILFGTKEGKIAFANRRKDPLYLFAAMQRHLGYPAVPRAEIFDDNQQLVPQLQRRVERMELRIKLLEEEQRQGIDISKFYTGPNGPRIELPPSD